MIDNGYDAFLVGWPVRQTCRFLITKDHKAYCGINRLKPHTCREYPFYNGKDGRRHVRPSEERECPSAGEFYESLSKVTGQPVETLLKTAIKALDEPPAASQREVLAASRPTQSEIQGYKKFIEYVEKTPTLAEKAEMLLNISSGWRIPVASSLGLSILKGHVANDVSVVQSLLTRELTKRRLCSPSAL
jgi:Fe-S-cluster containining protein